MGLHQDGAQRGPHRGAVADRQVPQALHCVDPLGERDRDADLAQLGDHAFQGGDHGPAFLGASETEAATTAAATDTATIITRLTVKPPGQSSSDSCKSIKNIRLGRTGLARGPGLVGASVAERVQAAGAPAWSFGSDGEVAGLLSSVG